FHRYDVTSERLRVTQGILSKRMREMEFYRVRETSLHQPFFLRIFRLANVVITVAGSDKPEFVIHAVPRAMELRENLRHCIETVREEKLFAAASMRIAGGRPGPGVTELSDAGVRRAVRAAARRPRRPSRRHGGRLEAGR
ncbi:MAG: PH domain-containing protein, partial [Myxococcota bacterium]